MQILSNRRHISITIRAPQGSGSTGVPPGRFGHTAVNDGNGTIYVYGGFTGTGGTPVNEVLALDTSVTPWKWTKINVPAEPRAFHSSVLLPDNTILHTFGQSGAAQTTAINTISIHNIATNEWVTSTPNFVVAIESPNKPADTSNRPGDPNYKHPGATPGDTNPDGSTKSGGSSGSNLGMILGIVVGCLAIIVLAVLFILRQRRRRRTTRPRTYDGSIGKNKTEDAKGSKFALNQPHHYDDSDKQKLARSFTIREPANAYVRDDRDLDQTHHPRYKSDADARATNAPYYGDRSSNGGTIIEYELTDTSGQAYGPGSVAERKRYVEEQQRQFMDGYDNIYAAGPPTPRSEQSSLPQLQVDHSPSLASRSTRTPRNNNYSRHDGYEEDIDDYYRN